eukprot:gene27657-36468_t
MITREAEIMQITGSSERWENWLQYTQSRLVPKFTDRGFDVITTPKFVHDKLIAAVRKSLSKGLKNIRSEGNVDVIWNPPGLDPKFIDLGSLTWETIENLKPYHEQWVGGIELVPTSAYGIRLYQNESTLVMHYDRIQTHVISSIVHVAHEYDDENEPWPIQIEDHDGNLHSVELAAGQMLFYESAKCLHGRMTTFRGKYYGSIFLHYRPKDESIWNYSIEDVIASVPPHWKEGIDPEDEGSRFSGAALSTDSRITERAPPRIVNGVLIADTPKKLYFPLEQYPIDSEPEL